MLKHTLKMADLAAEYKDLWRTVDMLRARRGDDTVPDWPAWCFMSSGMWQTFTQAFKKVRGEAGPTTDWLALACLAAWRPGQDVFRFEPELFEALSTTPLTTMPTEVLYRLPAWCVYIETPDVDWIGTDPMRGFFAWLDSAGPDLFLVPDYDSMAYTAITVRLTEAHLPAALSASIKARMPAATVEDTSKIALLTACTEKMLALVLYLCSTEPDVIDRAGSQTMPTQPMPKKVKTGWRLFAADKPTIWRVGDTIARQIRQATEAERGSHAGPRPHIRRAHWHGFWSGTIKPREGIEPTPRNFKLKWLPPTAVALGDDDNG